MLEIAVLQTATWLLSAVPVAIPRNWPASLIRMEAALNNPEELQCFTEILRLSHSYDYLQAWMWIRVLNEQRVKDHRDKEAVSRQVRQLWNIYLSEDGEKSIAVEAENIKEWGPHIENQLSLIEALLYTELQRSWTEYKSSPARRRFVDRLKHVRDKKKEKRSVSPKLSRRASESRLLRNSTEIREEFFKLGMLIRVA
jgi:hypothetical protein